MFLQATESPTSVCKNELFALLLHLLKLFWRMREGKIFGMRIGRTKLELPGGKTKFEIGLNRREPGKPIQRGNILNIGIAFEILSDFFEMNAS